MTNGLFQLIMIFESESSFKNVKFFEQVFYYLLWSFLI